MISGLLKCIFLIHKQVCHQKNVLWQRIETESVERRSYQHIPETCETRGNAKVSGALGRILGAFWGVKEASSPLTHPYPSNLPDKQPLMFLAELFPSFPRCLGLYSFPHKELHNHCDAMTGTPDLHQTGYCKVSKKSLLISPKKFCEWSCYFSS